MNDNEKDNGPEDGRRRQSFYAHELPEEWQVALANADVSHIHPEFNKLLAPEPGVEPFHVVEKPQ